MSLKGGLRTLERWPSVGRELLTGAPPSTRSDVRPRETRRSPVRARPLTTQS